MKIYGIWLICFLFRLESSPFFSNLSTMSNFIKRYEEFPLPDNYKKANPLNPTFSTYTMMGLSIKDKFLNTFRGLFNFPAKIGWPQDEFLSLLELVSNEQKENKKSATKLTAKPRERYIIWGDLQGAAHSFVRTLEELKKRLIIDDNFKLSPYCTIIILGDAIGRAAYSLEVLVIIFKLILANPKQVIYLQGKHEKDGYWHNFSTYRELDMKLSSNKKDMAVKILDTFFEELLNKVEIDYVDRHKETRSLLFSLLGFEKMRMAPTNVITTQLKSIDFEFVYRPIKGIAFCEPESGVTTWLVFSSPTYTSKSLYDFSNDSFCILEMAQNGYNWGLAHCYQDAYKKDGFKTDFYNFLTGQVLTQDQFTALLSAPQDYLPPITAPAIDHGDELVIGSYLDLRGPAMNIGQALRSGLSLAFNKENIEHGGWNNKFLRFVALDGQYSPMKASEAVININDIFKTDNVIEGFGGGTLEIILPILEKRNMAMFFPYTGVNLLRKANLKNVVNLQESFIAEANALVDYAVNVLQKRRIAIFYQNDVYGYSARDEAKKRLMEKYKVPSSDILEVTYPLGTLNVDEAALKIIEFAPSAILFSAIRVAAEALIRKIDLKYLADVSLLSISALTEGFRESLKLRGLSVIMAQDFPNPQGQSLIAQQYQSDISRYTPGARMDPDSLKGYVAGCVLFEAIKNIKGQITQESITRYFENMHDVEYKGLRLNFDPSTRQLLHTVWLDTGAQDWLPIDTVLNNVF